LSLPAHVPESSKPSSAPCVRRRLLTPARNEKDRAAASAARAVNDSPQRITVRHRNRSRCSLGTQGPRRLAAAMSSGFPRTFRHPAPFTLKSHYMLKGWPSPAPWRWIANSPANRGKASVSLWFATRIDPCDDMDEKEDM